MTLSLQSPLSKTLALFGVVFFALVLALVLMPRTASASDVTLVTATTTSNNAASTTLAKAGDTVHFGIQLSDTPWEAPQINIFGMGTSSFTGAGSYWQYSTTSPASTWTEGPISFYFSFSSTTVGFATTTGSQASLTNSNVVYDRTAPTGFSATMGTYVNRAASTTATFTFSGAAIYDTYIYELGNGTASTSGTGGPLASATDVSSSIDLSALSDGALTLNLRLIDPAGNKATATTSIADISTLDATVPDIPGASPAGGSYTASQNVTLSTSGSDSIHYTINNASTVTDPTCSTGSVYSSPILVNEAETIKAIGCDTAGNSSTIGSSAYTINTPGLSGGGGGSRSSSFSKTVAVSGGLSENQVQSILSLLTQFGADAAVIANVNASLHGQPSVSSPAAAGTSSFTRDLEVGSTGADVHALQVFLNAHGFVIATTGSGSPGNETSTFGALTKAALARFQAAKGITPSAGFFGPKTRAFVGGMH